eukprot:NODE_10373_length_1356_cov_11.279902.p1 GENE.NODE_10373_length_1356_cov_11.279902~~NODE_10373_length_1356_cov_11.279902.p1  ORF type:complete len:307 (+),score=82.73 NODE_10373_length_1356_cov_11.279902:245-1165(+)
MGQAVEGAGGLINDIGESVVGPVYTIDSPAAAATDPTGGAAGTGASEDTLEQAPLPQQAAAQGVALSSLGRSFAKARSAAGNCQMCVLGTLAAISSDEVSEVDREKEELLAAAAVETVAEIPKPSTDSRRVLKYCVSLDHEAGSSIGMDLDFLDGTSLNVCKVKPGTILEWNRKALREFRVRKGDRIDEINGCTGDAHSLIVEIEAGGHLEMWVTRPVPVRINVCRIEGMSLGLELDFVPNGSSLRVCKIGRGPIGIWNKRNPKEALTLNDRIITVNECEGLATQLMSEIRTATRLDLSCLRYAFC